MRGQHRSGNVSRETSGYRGRHARVRTLPYQGILATFAGLITGWTLWAGIVIK